MSLLTSQIEQELTTMSNNLLDIKTSMISMGINFSESTVLSTYANKLLEKILIMLSVHKVELFKEKFNH